MKKQIWLAATALLLSACASQPHATAPQADAAQAQQAITAAEASVNKADGVGFAWRDSEGLIKKAKEADQKKDYADAVKLADTARRQGELAYQQYADQNPATETATR